MVLLGTDDYLVYLFPRLSKSRQRSKMGRTYNTTTYMIDFALQIDECASFRGSTVVKPTELLKICLEGAGRQSEPVANDKVRIKHLG